VVRPGFSDAIDAASSALSLVVRSSTAAVVDTFGADGGSTVHVRFSNAVRRVPMLLRRISLTARTDRAVPVE
jgi:hypothetical protein